MSTTLATPTVIGPKVASIVVQQVTLRADGAVLIDWQGLDAAGQAVARQTAVFTPKDADANALLAAPASGLLAACEAELAKAIASGLSLEAPAASGAAAPPGLKANAGRADLIAAARLAEVRAARAKTAALPPAQPKPAEIAPATAAEAPISPAPPTEPAPVEAFPFGHPYHRS